MSFDPRTGGPCYLADIRRGACRQIADVRYDHTKWEAPKVSEEKHTPLPKLIMGDVEVLLPDGELGIPCDEAVIHFEGDEDSEINIRCPAALRIAPEIVRSVNALPALVKALEEIGKEVFTDGTPTKAARTARAALASVRGKR